MVPLVQFDDYFIHVLLFSHSLVSLAWFCWGSAWEFFSSSRSLKRIETKLVPVFSFGRCLDLLRSSILIHTLRSLQWMRFTLLVKTWAVNLLASFCYLLLSWELLILSLFLNISYVPLLWDEFLHWYYIYFTVNGASAQIASLSLVLVYQVINVLLFSLIHHFVHWPHNFSCISGKKLSSETILFIGITFSFLKRKVIMMWLHILSSFHHYFTGKHPIIFTITQNMTCWYLFKNLICIHLLFFVKFDTMKTKKKSHSYFPPVLLYMLKILLSFTQLILLRPMHDVSLWNAYS